MFKLNNFKQIKTTVLAIIGALLMVIGALYPDHVTPDNSESIRVAVNEILTGLGGLIATLTLIFGAKDG
jgi:hypothetical protein